MKLQVFILSLCVAALGSLHAQTTNYGTGSGSGGGNNAFFGTNSGNAVTSGGLYNVGAGHSTLTNITSGDHNIAIGGLSMLNTSTSSYNVAIGGLSMYSNTSGSSNTAVGYTSLQRNTSGRDNNAFGSNCLSYNTTGYDNSAFGTAAMYQNTTGYENVAVGGDALRQNTSGFRNAALGHSALQFNTGGDYNTAAGYAALYSNTTGYSNSAFGHLALFDNETGGRNVAVGERALTDNTTGYYNTASGYRASSSNTSGDFNVATGYYASYFNVTGNYNTGVGAYSNYYPSSVSYNTAIGYNAGTTSGANYSNATSIGYNAHATAANQVRVGNSSVNSIGGYANWTNVSDGRFKSNVQENVLGLDFINALRPVSYKLDRQKIYSFLNKGESEIAGIEYTGTEEYQTGFIAQEVEATAKALGFEKFNGVDVPNNENDPYGLRYSEFVVPLVQSVQELSAQNEEMKALIQQQQAQIDQLLNQGNTSNTSTINNTSAARMEQNNPNPFSEVANISVFLPEGSSKAFIMISNLEGKQLENIQIEQKGESQIAIEANKFQPGLYLYTLVVDGKIIATKKMLIVE